MSGESPRYRLGLPVVNARGSGWQSLFKISL